MKNSLKFFRSGVVNIPKRFATSFSPRLLLRGSASSVLKPLIVGSVAVPLAVKLSGITLAADDKPKEEKKREILKYKYVIVGAGATGWAAVKELVTLEPNATILIIGAEPYEPYKRPPLSKELWNSEDPNVAENLKFHDFMGKESDIWFDPKKFPGVNVIYDVLVSDMDADNNAVLLSSGTVVEYEKVLLATGGNPRKLPGVPRELIDRVSTYRTLDDFKELHQITSKKNVKDVIVIGGGFLGSELACSLAKRGKTQGYGVTQVFPECGMMCLNFPRYLSDYTTEKMRKELGMSVLPGKLVKQIREGPNNRVEVVLEGDQVVEGDHVVISVGIRPNNQLAMAAELEIDPKNGGIMVNQEFQASRSNIYAAGDVASYYDPVLGRRRVEHYDHAVMSGKFAARNMTGAKLPYLHQPFFWSDLGSIGYEAVGIVDANLRTVSVWEKPEQATENPEYKKGIVYYLSSENKVVGAILWNNYGKVDEAAAVIRRSRIVKDDAELKNLVSLEDKH